MTSVFCLKMRLQTTWSQNVIAQIFETYNALLYKLTMYYGENGKPFSLMGHKWRFTVQKQKSGSWI